jgi:ankyrin repeat protein
MKTFWCSGRDLIGRLIGRGRDNVALLKAAREGQSELARVLLTRGAEIEYAGADGSTALIEAARFGHADIVRDLLERGARVDHQDSDGGTALLMAALNGCVEAVKDLLDHGADIDHTNRRGQTALFLAAWYPAGRESPTGLTWLRHQGHDDVVRELLNRGANTEYFELGGLQPVSAAAKSGNISAVLDLLEGGARFLSDESVGGDLLRRAASQGDVGGLKALLDRGAEFFDLDDTDSQGRTPLTLAASFRRVAAAAELLDRGAIVSETDQAIFDQWLSWLEAQAEEAYDMMYDVRGSEASAGPYANAKDHLHDALAFARRLKRIDTVARLKARLDHIKAVFRSQFLP